MYNRFGVIVGMTDILLPYAVLILVNVLRGLTAGVAGGDLAWFWAVFAVPARRPAALAFGHSGLFTILVFVIGLAFFVTPAMLGSPRETMIANTISTEVEFLNWGFATALAILLLGATLLIVALMQVVFGNLLTIAPSLDGGRPPRASSVHVLPDRAVVALDRLLDRVWPAACAATASIVLALLILPILFIIPLSLTSVDDSVSRSPVILAVVSLLLQRRALDGSDGKQSSDRCVHGVRHLGHRRPGRARNRAHAQPNALAAYLFILSPLIVPTIITAISLYFFFIQIGLARSTTGLVLGHTVGALPIAVVVLVTAFSDFDWTLERAALSLGSSSFDAARASRVAACSGHRCDGRLPGFPVPFRRSLGCAVCRGN